MFSGQEVPVKVIILSIQKMPTRYFWKNFDTSLLAFNETCPSSVEGMGMVACRGVCQTWVGVEIKQNKMKLNY